MIQNLFLSRFLVRTRQASTTPTACTHSLLNTSPKSRILKLETGNAYNVCHRMSLRTYYTRFSKKMNGFLFCLVECWEQLWAWHKSTFSQIKSLLAMESRDIIAICSPIQSCQRQLGTRRSTVKRVGNFNSARFRVYELIQDLKNSEI